MCFDILCLFVQIACISVRKNPEQLARSPKLSWFNLYSYIAHIQLSYLHPRAICSIGFQNWERKARPPTPESKESRSFPQFANVPLLVTSQSKFVGRNNGSQRRSNCLSQGRVSRLGGGSCIISGGLRVRLVLGQAVTGL